MINLETFDMSCYSDMKLNLEKYIQHLLTFIFTMIFNQMFNLINLSFLLHAN